MAYEIISVTFDVDAQTKQSGRFTVPQKICALFGFESGDKVALEIAGHHSKPVETELVSGTEIYGLELELGIASGERLRVTISRPSAGEGRL
jgi:bifunctional DNA-binding transcriptional regulator/antitoxin component of YhaV-PrlF toxin-antitoxin module